MELDRQLDENYEVKISQVDHDPLAVYSCVCPNT